MAILWLYRAIQPFFAETPPPSKGKPKIKHRDDDDEGDYIDYEEIDSGK
ncbi:MAG: hypothetical protein R2778_12280 [Saprospiraceae bacterium]